MEVILRGKDDQMADDASVAEFADSTLPTYAPNIHHYFLDFPRSTLLLVLLQLGEPSL